MSKPNLVVKYFPYKTHFFLLKIPQCVYAFYISPFLHVCICVSMYLRVKSCPPNCGFLHGSSPLSPPSYPEQFPVHVQWRNKIHDDTTHPYILQEENEVWWKLGWNGLPDTFAFLFSYNKGSLMHIMCNLNGSAFHGIFTSSFSQF